MSKTEKKLPKILKKYGIENFHNVENIDSLINEIKKYFGCLTMNEEQILRISYVLNF